MIGKRKKRSVTERSSGPPRPERPTIPLALLVRMFVVGSIAVGASVWAIWRHYTVPRMPMVVPVPSASATETEIEIEPP
jgi:hypothetical protein